MMGEKSQHPDPLDGMSLRIEEKRRWRFGPHPSSHVEALEIGATSPGKLQFVMLSENRRATVELSVEQARWLAMALNYWADSSENIIIN